MIIEIKYSVGIIVSLTQICFIIFVWRKIRFYRSITQIVITVPFSRGRGDGDDFVDVNKTRTILVTSPRWSSVWGEY
nr:MAG TPA: hypothetical protein [Caudoviricetes sp.]